MRLVICDANRILRKALAAALQACGHAVSAVAAAADCIVAVASYQANLLAEMTAAGSPARRDKQRLLHST